MAVRVLGIRHHGPGSARAVQHALETDPPDCVLIEGPADASGLIHWVADQQLAPPVALLAWNLADPRRSAFWPFAVFSPEWQAMSWAVAHEVPVRFIDLPSTALLEVVEQPDDEKTDDDQAREADDESPESEDSAEESGDDQRQDPIGLLAQAAGYDDPEAWWEDVIELRGDGDTFELITEAMSELRDQIGEEREQTLVREAHMRKQLRAAIKEGFEQIVVVCGAWHAPALSGKLPAVSADNALLRSLPKVKTDITWVPWTHSRLAMASGYGAGVVSPGWYHHLFTTTKDPIARWLTQVAQVLRAEDLPVSTAHVIEAVRLAEALGGLRGRPMPGLSEVTEATWSVICDGNEVLLDLVTRKAVVGESLGEVPDEVPMVPLDADLRARAKRLRLKFEASAKALTLDLRKDNDLAKSQLLRQLRILGIGWGTPDAANTTGTFKEVWQLAWEPEFAVAIVEAGQHGTTVAAAAGAVLLEGASSLAKVTDALEIALAAGLDEIVDDLLSRLDVLAAHEADVTQLLKAVPPLARVQRYGDVRRTDTTRLAAVARAILGRACAGLPAASSGLGTEAALALRSALDQVQQVIGLLDDNTAALWAETLTEVAARRDVPGILAGRVVRILLDGGQIDRDEAAARLSRTLSAGTDPMAQAAWIEGFLAGNPLLVIHDDQLIRGLDEWLSGIGEETFTDLLPILRRAFGDWDKAARRQLAGQIMRLDGAAAQQLGQGRDLVLDEVLTRVARSILFPQGANA